MTEESHNAEVVLVNARRDVPHYQAKCPTCGKVGQPQRLRDDAQAIADRHFEVGGFERLPALDPEPRRPRGFQFDSVLGGRRAGL